VQAASIRLDDTLAADHHTITIERYCAGLMTCSLSLVGIRYQIIVNTFK